MDLTLAIRERAAVVIPLSRGRILRELLFQPNYPAATPVTAPRVNNTPRPFVRPTRRARSVSLSLFLSLSKWIHDEFLFRGLHARARVELFLGLRFHSRFVTPRGHRHHQPPFDQRRDRPFSFPRQSMRHAAIPNVTVQATASGANGFF